MKSPTLRDINEANKRLWTPDKKLMLPEGGGDLGPYLQRGATRLDGLTDYFRGPLTGMPSAAAGVVLSAWLKPGATVDGMAFFGNDFIYSTSPSLALPPALQFAIYFDGGYEGAPERYYIDLFSGRIDAGVGHVIAARKYFPVGYDPDKEHNVLLSQHYVDGSYEIYWDDEPMEDDANSTTTGTPFTLDLSAVPNWNVGQNPFTINGGSPGNQRYVGCTSELFVKLFAGAVPPFSDVANRRKFIDEHRRPVDLGPRGQYPYGVPANYYSPRGNGVNKGIGGSLPTFGAPSVCGSHP